MKAGKREQLKLNVNKEGKDALIYVLSNALIQFGNLIVVPLFWKKLSPEDYGIIAITEIIGAFLGIFLGLSLEQSINKFYYEWTGEQRKRGIGAIWVVSWSSSIIFGILSIFMFSFITEYIFNGINFYPYIYMGLISIVLNSLGIITFTTLRIKRVPWLYSIYSLSIFLIYLSLRTYCVLIDNQGLIGYFKANIVGASIIIALAIVIMSKFARPCLRNSGLIASLKFALPIIPSSIISVFTSISDRFILQNVASLSILGIYSISLKFASIITVLHDGIKSSYSPYLWQTVNKEINAKYIIAKKATIFIMPIYIAGIFISLYIDDIIQLINRPLYFPVADLVPWVVGFTLISCHYLYYSPGMMLGNRTDLLWIPATLQLIALYASIFTFKQVGFVEIIIAKYVATLVYFLTSYYLSQRYYCVPYKINRLILISCVYIFLLTVYISFKAHNPYVLFMEKFVLLMLFLLFSCLMILDDNIRFENKVFVAIRRFVSR